MSRESTIKYTFQLEDAPRAESVLTAPGITKGATTLLHLDDADPGIVADPPWYVVGESVFIDGTGFETLDGKVHPITVVNVGTGVITLGVNTSAEAGTPTLADIVAYPFEWIDVCLSEFTPNPGTPGEIDTTTMCDDERKNLPGLPTPGTATLTGMFDLDDTGMLALIAAQKDGVKRYLVGVTRFGQAAVFHGVVSSFSIGALTVEAAVTFSGTFTLDESPYYFKAPVVTP